MRRSGPLGEPLVLTTRARSTTPGWWTAIRGDTIKGVCLGILAFVMLVAALATSGSAAMAGDKRHDPGLRVNQVRTECSPEIQAKFMIDGGSNTNLIKLERSQAERLGLLATQNSNIAGFAIGSSITSQGTLCAAAGFADRALLSQGTLCAAAGFADRVLLDLFGTHALFHEEKEASGTKGSLTKPRASRGMIVGTQEREVRINTRSLTQASDAERSVDDTTPQQLQASDKATQNTIDVHTDLGTAQYRVPATKHEVMDSPHQCCEEWMKADRRALDVILRDGNKLVSTKVQEGNLGVLIARTVTARGLKTDPARGRLAEKNAYKSRHTAGKPEEQPDVDAVPATLTVVDDMSLKQATGELTKQPDVDAVPATSTVVDVMYLKTFLAYTAKHDLELTRRGDIGNAYAKAKSIRELGYMHLPSTLRSLDEDGEPPCIEWHTPIWGEREAGYKWQCTFAESILKMGWKSCEGVTAMHAVQKPVGGIAATISTIVDDFLIAKSGNPITRAMLANLKAIFEKLAIQSAPDSFSGYKIARNRTSCAITMSMPQKIIEAAHAPQDETHAVAK